MRAVQARLPRGQLAELGAAFRQRLDEQLGVAAAAAGQAVGSMVAENHCGATCFGSEAVGGDLLVLQESAGGQALLVALTDSTEGSGSSSSSRRPCSAPGPGADVQGGAAAATARLPLSRHSSSSSKLVGKSRAGSGDGGSAAASQPASAVASRRSSPERERLEQQPAGAGR
jgi:hypothetical protein